MKCISPAPFAPLHRHGYGWFKQERSLITIPFNASQAMNDRPLDSAVYAVNVRFDHIAESDVMRVWIIDIVSIVRIIGMGLFWWVLVSMLECVATALLVLAVKNGSLTSLIGILLLYIVHWQHMSPIHLSRFPRIHQALLWEKLDKLISAQYRCFFHTCSHPETALFRNDFNEGCFYF